MIDHNLVSLMLSNNFNAASNARGLLELPLSCQPRPVPVYHILRSAIACLVPSLVIRGIL